MNGRIDIDTKPLSAEIERYLAAVEVYRAEGCEPTWRPEPSTIAGLILPHVREPREGNQTRVH